MTNRVSKRLVTFAHPFRLDSIERQWPAGEYTIETDEEPLDSNSFVAFRTVGTTMIVYPRPGRSGQHMFIEIDAGELEAALLRDRDGIDRAENEGMSA